MKLAITILWILLFVGVLTGLAQAQYSAQDVYNPNRTHPSQVLLDLQMMSNEQRVDTAMSLLLGHSESGPAIATQILLNQEDQYVVDPIIRAITYEVVLENDTRRRYAFIILAAKQSWPNPATYELLTQGLIDWRVNDVCKDALMAAPLERRPDAVPVMSRYLKEWYPVHPRATAELLEILGSFGVDSRDAIDIVKLVYASPSELWPENRVYAAVTLAQIGGLSLALESYNDLDTLQYRAAIAGLEYLGSLEPSPYAAGSAQTDAALELLHGAFGTPSDSVVWAALTAVPAIYGDDLYVFEARDSATLNPQLKNALITGAEQQKDPRLRNILVAALREYEAGATGQ